jgi:hypothetical protein
VLGAVAALGVIVFYIYCEQFVFRRPLFGIRIAPLIWHYIMLGAGLMSALVVAYMVPKAHQAIRAKMHILDRDDRLALATSLALGLTSSLFASVEMMIGIEGLGLDAFQQSPMHAFAVFGIALQIMLNGLCLDLFEHFSLVVVDVAPRNRLGLLWITLFAFRCFYAYFLVSTVLLIYELLRAPSMGKSDAGQ